MKTHPPARSRTTPSFAAMAAVAVLLAAAPPGWAALSPPADEPPADGAFAEALHRAATTGPPWNELSIVVECTRDRGFESVELMGRGIGVWGKKRQFRLDQEKIWDLVRRLDAAGFAGLDLLYGGPVDGMEDPRRPDPSEIGALAATKIACRIEVTVAGERKQVAQRLIGKQLELIFDLAESVFTACEEPARAGVAAASLGDGLRKVAAGELAPEMLQVVAVRQDAPDGPDGFMLRLAGGEVVSRAIGDPSSERRLELDAAGLAELAERLSAASPDDLPRNLWADRYTSLTVQVLDQRKEIQARRFSDMTARTHGSRQRQFDRLLGRFEELHRRVLAEGGATAVPAAPTGGN